MEGGYGNTTSSIDLDIGVGSSFRVAYGFFQTGEYPEVRVATRNPEPNPNGWWTVTDALEVYNVRAISMAEFQGAPLIAWSGDTEIGTPCVAVFYYLGGLPIVDLVEYTEYPVWQVVAEVSPAGVVHVAYYESPDPGEGLPSYVKHAWQAPMEIGRWTIDTVAVSGGELGEGAPRWPLSLMLHGENVLIGFPYYVDAAWATKRVYLAERGEDVSVPIRPTTTLLVNGPWPNPGLRGKVGRISFEVPVRQELEFSLFDVTGKRVMREVREASPGSRGSLVWNLGGLRPGVYWLRGLSSTGQSVVRKWVILG